MEIKFVFMCQTERLELINPELYMKAIQRESARQREAEALCTDESNILGLHLLQQQEAQFKELSEDQCKELSTQPLRGNTSNNKHDSLPDDLLSTHSVVSSITLLHTSSVAR